MTERVRTSLFALAAVASVAGFAAGAAQAGATRPMIEATPASGDPAVVGGQRIVGSTPGAAHAAARDAQVNHGVDGISGGVVTFHPLPRETVEPFRRGLASEPVDAGPEIRTLSDAKAEARYRQQLESARALAAMRASGPVGLERYNAAPAVPARP